MPLTFRGSPVLGTCGQLQVGEWDPLLARTVFFGVIGESEIVGGVGGRDIECEVWIHNSWNNSAAVVNAITTLENATNSNGLLVESGPVYREFPNCTFLGCRVDRGPLPSNTVGWFAIATLRWRQLQP